MNDVIFTENPTYDFQFEEHIIHFDFDKYTYDCINDLDFNTKLNENNEFITLQRLMDLKHKASINNLDENSFQEFCSLKQDYIKLLSQKRAVKKSL